MLGDLRLAVVGLGLRLRFGRDGGGTHLRVGGDLRDGVCHFLRDDAHADCAGEHLPVHDGLGDLLVGGGLHEHRQLVCVVGLALAVHDGDLDAVHDACADACVGECFTQRLFRFLLLCFRLCAGFLSQQVQAGCLLY